MATRLEAPEVGPRDVEGDVQITGVTRRFGDVVALRDVSLRAAPGEEELLLIAVAPEHRGKGLGTRLLHQVLEDARNRGAERVFLEMRFNNPAIELYQKAGFTPIGRRKHYYNLPDGSRIDAITFACHL